MKYDEIIKLLDAGYTRDEILAMNEEKSVDPVDVPADEPEKPDMTEVFKEMRDMFADMRKEFTAMNIMNSQLPADSEKTPDDIIANIINPVKQKN